MNDKYQHKNQLMQEKKNGELILLFLIKYLQDVHLLKYHVLLKNIIKFKVIVFQKVLKKNFLEILKKSLKSIIYALVSPSEYFATRVKDAIKGFGTDDSLLIRILISRDEIDIP